MFSLILLSAGLSSRFGSPKALAPWGQGLLINHLLKIFIDSSLDEVVVVLGAHKDQIEPQLLKHNKIKVVYNKDYKFGQTSSLKAGLREVSPLSKAFGLYPVDFPLIKKETINMLIGDFVLNRPLILVPSYDNQKGHPPFFNMSLKQEILRLSHNVGLNTVIHQHRDETRICEVNDEGIVLSFNTPQELTILQQRFI